MSNSITKACALVLMVSVVAGCSEPQQSPSGPQSVASATDAEKASADAGFGAVKPVELAHTERKLPLTPTSDCNLERVNGAVFAGVPVDVSGARTLRLSGWVANTEETTVPVEADLRLISGTDNRAWEIPVKPEMERKDVQKLLGGDPAFASAGYSVNIDVSDLPAGRYRIYTVISALSGLKVCDKGRTIELTN